MRLIFPWALLWLLPIVAAAFWTLRRRSRRIVLVGSLSLWARAMKEARTQAGRPRRVNVAWVLLLAGALAAGLALSRPILYSRPPARRIAVAVWPGAELGAAGGRTLAEIVQPLLGRLDGADRVRLILPTVMGGSSGFLTAEETARRLAAVRALPAAAVDLKVPAEPEGVQHLYRFAPATVKMADGPDTTTIMLPARPGQVTIDAFAVGIEKTHRAAADVSSPAQAQPVQVFVALRNHTSEPARGRVLVADAEGERVAYDYDLAAAGRQSLIAELAGGSQYYLARIAGVTGPGAAAFAARRPGKTAAIAIVGRSDPLVRRFVRIHPSLLPVNDPDKADAVIAIGAEAPAGKPALLIDPPAPPPGWRAGDSLANVALRDAGVLADHPILAGVDLGAIAVRRSDAWAGPAPMSGPASGRSLVSIAGDAIVVVQTAPHRVYVAFDVAVENTNFAMTDSFVVFMANVLKYLIPRAGHRDIYEYITPLEAGAGRHWEPAAAAERSAGRAQADGRLVWPGVYRDAQGALRAVSLTGLRSAEPASAAADRVAGIALPEPEPLAGSVELWPILALSAGLLWLAGWALRPR